MAACRPACQEMQPAGLAQSGLPIAQPGRPFYFVEVSELPQPNEAPLDALAPRNLYSRLPSVRAPALLC